MSTIVEPKNRTTSESPSTTGVFDDVDAAVAAARKAFEAYSSCSLTQRSTFIDAIRKAASADEALNFMATSAVEETQMGNARHKVLKNYYAATRSPGIEDLTIQALQGDSGLTTLEYAPYGVIGAIAPTTNPTETIICNTIGMLAAGNTVVFSPHPRARKISIWLVDVLNRAMMEAGAPENLITIISTPSVENTKKLISHRDISMLVATGGPQIVNMVLTSGKKAIGAGSGNPPVLVDETADLAKAAHDIVTGASFDNNLPCTAEKEIIAVECIADELKAAMLANGAYELSPDQVKQLEAILLGKRGPATEWVGKPAAKILDAIGVNAPADTRLLVFEASADHPFVVEEMMMPIIGLVRVPNVEKAIQLAIQLEHGNRHTAIMHSRDVSRLTDMGQRIQTTIFVKNGPSFNGIGIGGEGYVTFTIAGPTGEGLTRARNFARVRRCVMVEGLNVR